VAISAPLKKLKITKEAEVTGGIHTPNLNIEKGALFEGRCSMPKNRTL
jgi:cytoskeletal protein CcmA (bactofilin family)